MLICIGAVLWAGKWVAQALLPAFNFIADKTTQVVSQQIGTKPQLDEYGSLNVLLMGYG
ncbi:MAG: hypothetical protein H6766_04555 [Candidatus Peribacteria bacterium]|nr:MAG: hypothetical protein H6766_04555 [Candidatus Peribacteria bacterium]